MMDVFRHLFTPHHTNNHRAKILHVDAMAIYVLVFVIVNVAIRVGHHELPQVLGYATDIYVDQLLATTNTERAQAGLTPLTLNSQLSHAAALKAEDMFANHYWAHNSPQGKTPWEFITAAGYKYTLAGENLAKNFNDSEGVVKAWMASPTHRDNILKSGYKEVGFAVVNGVLNGEETTLVVQMFGSANAPIRSARVEIPEVSAKTAAQIPARQAETAENVKLGEQTKGTEIVPIVTAAPTAEMPAFTGVSLEPLINLSSATRGLAFAFIGFLLVAFAVDTYIVARKKIVRVTGHNLAHVLFLAAITVALAVTVPGAIL